ncbi:MAG: class I tRNA ligase family protein [Candidatus Campbellbacteria bacterium]|nr:class I tRNA ligase family protein [Candidatus Campbellbacteria bacterium]
MSNDLNSQEMNSKKTKENVKKKEKENSKENVEIKAESEVSKREEDILEFWNESDIFLKSLSKPSPEGEFVFYDGPPFATGLPHYGHLLAGTIKDIIPRFQTMRGKHVRRVWGWDVHGLPIENLIEKKFGVNTKREIEDLGIDKFNEEARGSVLKYRDEWRKIVPRTGRFVDMENDYKTMDPEYSETTWWIFKTLFEKDLVYEGFKSMHLCPRCGTTLSNFEVNLGYQDIKDLSVTTKFELKEEPGTFLLTWTTTPWTLPGNVAVGVHKDIDYIAVTVPENIEELGFDLKSDIDPGTYIFAKEAGQKDSSNEGKLHQLFWLAGKSEIQTKEMKGSDLVGLSYKPPFPYFLDKDLPNKENAWKIYDADYVTTDDGTGIVHLAPAFGEEDLLLAQEKNIPIVHHVNFEGAFTEDVVDFAGEKVKPKDEDGEDHMATDIKIIKWLAENNLLFAKEKITHSYPLCWRCDTPLLNYATTSWFIAVTDIKDEIIKANEGVSWTPDHIGTGRFGKWLENARDWAVSRSRYWGSPLPVWRNEETKEMEVIGSVEELRKKSRGALTRIITMRHAESEKNVLNVLDSSLDKYGLTETGVKEAKEAAKKLSGSVDVIYSSPVLRARKTAEIVAEELGLEVKIAEEVSEVDSGDWEKETLDSERVKEERKEYFSLPPQEQFEAVRGTNGESWKEVSDRVNRFLENATHKHAGESVLVVAHQGIVAEIERSIENKEINEELLHRQSVGRFAFPIRFDVRTDTGRQFDFHRPYIDQIKVYSESGTELTRVAEVFDTWYESGSMPYAQHHYPFENRDIFEPEGNKGFPADFIAEGLDQTRGWFYSLLVLGVGLFNKSPYKNVIVNGIILSEDGQKMSKRLLNYPDPLEVISKYGADSLRLYMSSSSVVRAESLNFSEKGVAEISRKVIGRLDNVYKFYEIYRDRSLEEEKELEESENVLDIWIESRLSKTEQMVRHSLDNYELDKATRPLFDFVEDLSTWYLRRSRDRFKGENSEDGKMSRRVLYTTLKTFALISAPFMPFYADYLYRSLRGESDPESVHLESWPTLKKPNGDILEKMKRVREIVSEGLEERNKEGIKVRQPLASLSYGGEKLDDTMESIISDEMNVKSVKYEEGKSEVEIDSHITEELRKEGIAREVIRTVQNERKNLGLNPRDLVNVYFHSDKEEFDSIVEEYKEEIKEASNAEKLIVGPIDNTQTGTTQSIGDFEVTLVVEKL